MCEPVSATMAALAVVSTATGAAQADANARATNQYNEEMFERNKLMAEHASVEQHVGLASARSQEREVDQREALQVSKEADMARSTARVAALESGNSGASLESLLDDFDRQEADYVVTTKRNQRFADEQFEANSSAIAAGAEGRIDSARRAEVARPSFLNTALQMGAAGLSAHALNPVTQARVQSGGGFFI